MSYYILSIYRAIIYHFCADITAAAAAAIDTAAATSAAS